MRACNNVRIFASGVSRQACMHTIMWLKKIPSRRKDYSHVVLLVSLDRVGLDKLAAVLNNFFVDLLVPVLVTWLFRSVEFLLRQTDVNVCRWLLVNVVPDVFRPCIFDQLLEFVKKINSDLKVAHVFQRKEQIDMTIKLVERWYRSDSSLRRTPTSEANARLSTNKT
jgi:hypothetical protein